MSEEMLKPWNEVFEAVIKKLKYECSFCGNTESHNTSRALEEIEVCINSIKAYKLLGDGTHLGIEYLTKIKRILGGQIDE